MTPKEKAKDLFTDYLILFPEFHNDLEYGYNDVKAKQCALIAVKELIKETGSKYWYDVKQEIELL